MLPYRDSRFLRITLALFFGALFLYALYEAQGFLFGPRIVVPESILTSTEEIVIIKGRAERIIELLLNGAPIPVTESGDFAERHLLSPGSNLVLLEARDGRGRRVERTIEIVYNPLPPGE